MALIGKGPELKKNMTSFLEFAKAWGGGKDGCILTDLESYEKTLNVKRKLYPADLKNLASIDPVELEIFVPAMIKGMLNSPNEFTDSLSYSTLFPSKGSDASTIQINGRNRPFAIAANKMMNASRNFLKAYGSRIGKLEQTKLLADVEVRCSVRGLIRGTNTTL